MPPKYGSKRRPKFLKCSNKTFVANSKKIHGNRYDYSKVKYVNNYTKVIIICKKHGEFKQRPFAHINQGQGCRKCTIDGSKTTPESFIERANKVHDNKYDYSKTKYINRITKVTIICKQHGEFEQRPYCHIGQKQGCPSCGNINKGTQINFSRKPLSYGEKVYCRLTNESIIERANKIHNNKYDYSKMNYVKNAIKIEIICPIVQDNKPHGLFTQTAYAHFSGQGCPKCKNNNIGNKLRKTNAEFIKQANEVHNNRYDYSKVNLINVNTKIDIICKIHGVFTQTPSHHLQGCVLVQ